jgi:hypothetical protein
MSDLSFIQSCAPVIIVGADSTGLETNPVNSDVNGNLYVRPASNGPVTPGTVASFSNLVGAQYNSSLPILTTGQQSALQIDANGRLIVSASISSTGIADKTTFTYGSSNFQTIGGVYQDTSPTLTAGQSGVIRLTQNRAIHINIRDSAGSEKLGSSLSAASIPVVIASDQSTISVSDVLSTSTGVQDAINVGTTSVEAKVGASRLTGRKILSVFHNGSGKLYWGYSSGVTTSTGIQIFKNTQISWPAGANTSVFLIADSATNDVRVAEGA